jgi:nucleoside-triphosphatase THEP1
LTKNKPIVFIISGQTGSGKTTFLDRLTERLREHNLTVAGFLAVRSGTSDFEQTYDILIFESRKSMALATREYVRNWTKIGNFYFNPEAILKGNRILNDPQILNKDLIVVDEIGIFELEGKIWADSISHLVSKSEKMMIWVVRDTLIEKVIEKWSLQKPVIIDIQKVSIRQAEEKILSMFEIH